MFIVGFHLGGLGMVAVSADRLIAVRFFGFYYKLTRRSAQDQLIRY